MSEFFEDIKAGLEDAIAYSKGDKTKGRAHRIRMEDIDVKAIRNNLHMTQAEFGESFAIPVPTLKKWEGGQRVPEGPTKAYLKVIQAAPEVVLNTLFPSAVKTKTRRIAKKPVKRRVRKSRFQRAS